MLTILKFVKNHGPYSPGDVAGFKDAAARDFLAGGIAELAAPAPVAEVALVAPKAADVGETAQTAPAARRGRPPKS